MFSYLAGKCRDPPQVTKASHDGPEGHTVFPLGTQLTYTCKSGYNMDGFFRAMCVGEGRWVGPRMTCSRKTCYLMYFCNVELWKRTQSLVTSNNT